LTHQPWQQFSEVNALVHLLYNGNIQGTFENMCRRRAHALPWGLRPRAVVAARPWQGSRASAAAHRASARRAACHRYALDLRIERGRRARHKRATFLAQKKNLTSQFPAHLLWKVTVDIVLVRMCAPPVGRCCARVGRVRADDLDAWRRRRRRSYSYSMIL
jgi:hypothetical protein